jgi:hypothetical protein
MSFTHVQNTRRSGAAPARWGCWVILVLLCVCTSCSTAPDRRVYAVAAAGEAGVVIGGAGNVALTATGLNMALELATQEGWTVHSVVYNTEMGGYTVVLER